MSPEGYVYHTDHKGDIQDDDKDDWCNDNCEKCIHLKSVLTPVKTRFTLKDGTYVWRSKLSHEHISNLDEGTYVIGDLQTIGWVIIKSKIWYLGDKDLTQWYLDIVSITAFPSTWKRIQVPPNTARSYNMSEPNTCQSQMYKDIGGFRKQKWPNNEATHLTEFPGIMKWFEINLKVVYKYITWNTNIFANYKFSGINFVSHCGTVLDQSPHTDYKKIHAPNTYDYKEEEENLDNMDIQNKDTDEDCVTFRYSDFNRSTDIVTV